MLISNGVKVDLIQFQNACAGFTLNMFLEYFF